MLIMPLLVVLPMTIAQDVASPPEARIEGDSQLEVTVGMAGFLKQVVLPGTELKVREVDPRTTSIAVRIDSVYAHGDGFRYDLTWFGLEPGSHNLCDYLARKDGTASDDLPEISLTVKSVLPPEQIRPHAADPGLLARIGGYGTRVIAAIFVWIIGLAAILFVGRSKKSAAAARTTEAPATTIDHIRRLVDQALQKGELSAADKADMDVRILTFWRERRQLDDVSPGEALTILKNDAEAGPLLTGIERWFHSRHTPDRDEILALLEPLARLAAMEVPVRKAAEGSAP